MLLTNVKKISSCKRITPRQRPLAAAISLALFASANINIANAVETETTLDAVMVWGEQKKSEQAGYTSPVSTLTQEDLASINMATTEDSVKYEPSIVIRRRFIGDSNGTLGMRGSNMFQTSRSMVFADGVPLHYLLESRWAGAPRWTMVSSSEIAQVDVVYGPFSAEYSGNSMGGVVLIETNIPQQREFHFDGMMFSQAFDDYGFDDDVNGYKGFMSYGDKMGDLSIYLSYNHLDNEAQPQSFRFNAINSTPSGVAATGGIIGNDSRGVEKMFYGDSGVVDTNTDNYKVKLGYDFGNWFGLLNIAYEDRHSENVGNSYIRDASGNSLWSGDVTQNGQSYSLKASSTNGREMYRDSLNVGLRLKGDLSETTQMEINLSSFDVLKDESRSSAFNPNDPAFTGAGSVEDYGNTGWKTAEVKWIVDELGVENLSLVTGARHEAYELNIDVFDSTNYATGSKDTLSDSSGGESSLTAAFAQFIWEIDERWDSSVGLRYESWKSKNGYYVDDDAGTPELDLVNTPSRSENHFSPKFSLGLKPADEWIVRYSLAKAYRFPIVEELYSQFEAFASKNLANPDLDPEEGLHHNVMIERGLDQGYVRVNLYRENIDNVIESQTTLLDGGVSLRTFIPVDEVQTTGIEFIVNAENVFIDALDIRYNVTYTDSEIIKNDADTSLEGNHFPRMPEWRSNLLATYHISNTWDVGGSIQYASDSFGRLDNKDEEDNVIGSQDNYTRFGLKTSYKLDKNSSIGLGVDNLTNEVAYVHHPWPGRTFYLTASYDL
ncbi:MAG: TonB-dependent receptor [Pseudomonadales bacterium]|nr:TonB-dependent receptor [Pseudomonadales bacterium]